MYNENKNDRQSKEMQSLFKDPRYARMAWRNVGLAILSSPAVKPVGGSGKDGMDTYDDVVERYSYNSLARDVQALVDAAGKPQEPREPTELEMIFRCQAIHARHNPASAQFIRDTVGAKPVDESKVEQTNLNVYETLTDDELEALAAYREEKQRLDELQAQQQLDAASASSDGTAAQPHCNKEEY